LTINNFFVGLRPEALKEKKAAAIARIVTAHTGPTRVE
jgi:hypothetical protein